MQTVTWRLGAAAALGLANSRHGPGAHYRRRASPSEPDHDHLVEPDDAVAFLTTHHVPAPAGVADDGSPAGVADDGSPAAPSPEPGAVPTRAQLARLRALRDRVRALADDPDLDPEAWHATTLAELRDVELRVGVDGALRSTAPGWDGVLDDLLPAALALLPDRARLRHCGNPLCRWLFVDRTPRGNRIWCEAAVCGNRVKVGRHRLRAAGVSRRGRPSGPRD